MSASSEEQHPRLTVVAGPNGVGKSTFVSELVESGYDIGTFVNPDVVARSLQDASGNPEPPANLNFAAGREALRLTRELIARQQNFTRESTLTSNEILRTMQAAKDAGYKVTLMFVGVDSVETSKGRVRNRVREGGHNIPEEAQERRFERSFQNAPRAAAIADRAFFFHSGEAGYELVAEVENGLVTKIGLERVAWMGKALSGLGFAENVEAIAAPAEYAPLQEVSLEAQIAFITEILPGAVALENAARRHSNTQLRGSFTVDTTDTGERGITYELQEAGELLFAATVRDRQISEIAAFNVKTQDFEQVKARLSRQRNLTANLLKHSRERGLEL